MDVNLVSQDRDAMYAYAYGMVSGMYGRLLQKKDYELLIQAGSIEEVLVDLENTLYGRDIRKLKQGFSLLDIEEALTAGFRRAYSELSGNLPAQDKACFDRIMLGGWDIDNIKTVSRAIRAGVGGKTIGGFITAYGRLGVQELTALAQLPNISELPAKLDKPYSEMVEEALLKETQLEYEEELDRQFISELMEDAGGQLRDYVELLVDVLNLKTILRCTLAGVEAAPHMIGEGYHLKGRRLSDMAKTDAEGVAKSLEDTPYSRVVQDTLTGDGGASIMNLDIRLNAVLTREAEYQAIRKPVGVASIIAYIRRMQGEVEHIRAVIAGKWYELTTDEIRGLVA